MKAIDFFIEYQSLFDASKSSNILSYAKDKWNSRKQFTKFIIPYIDSILINSGYDNEHLHEYFKIDVIGWKGCIKEIEEIKKPSGYAIKDHFWRLGVAVEHENDQFDWTGELIKLMYINCPLRVVIGYYPENQKENLKQILDYASKLVSLANIEENLIRGKQEFLLILGENHADANKLNKDTYSAFVYDVKQKKFKSIQE